jgi:hypothetical protein
MGLDCELGHPSQGLCVRLQVGHAFCNFFTVLWQIWDCWPSLKPFLRWVTCCHLVCYDEPSLLAVKFVALMVQVDLPHI